MHRMSERLGEALDLDEPLPLDKNAYLGCGQQNIKAPQDYISGKQEFYKNLLADNVHATDQLSDLAKDESAKRGVKQEIRAAHEAGGDSLHSTKKARDVKGYQYDMTGHAEQCVQRYLELAKLDRKTLKKVATPCMSTTLREMSQNGMSPASKDSIGSSHTPKAPKTGCNTAL